MAGEKRLDTFGAPPVRGGSSAVQRCLPLVPGHVADPRPCCSLVHAGGTFVRLGNRLRQLYRYTIDIAFGLSGCREHPYR
jgi:hypothetical protein